MENIEQELQRIKAKTQFTREATYNCDRCQDTGVQICVRQDGNTAAIRCKCRYIDPVDTALKYHYDTELARVYSGKRIADFRPELYPSEDHVNAHKLKRIAINFVKKYKEIRDHKTDLYFYSETPGSGKTMLACLIAKGLSNVYKRKSQAITTGNLIRTLRSSFDNPKLSEDDILNRIKSIDVLMLDEIGGEKHGEYSEEVLTSIINHRIESGLTTIYTSNYPVNHLVYHNRLKDRIVAKSVRAAFPEFSVRAKIGQKEANVVNDLLINNLNGK